ncbi:MAG: TraV family lipoprotein, partial [Sutterella sp.]|nr:TraV family lipoprotein [Sutterella sp.]
ARPKPGRCHTFAQRLPLALSLTIAGSLLSGCGTITGLDAGSTFSCNVPEGVPCQNLASAYVSSLAQSDANTGTDVGAGDTQETTKSTTPENGATAGKAQRTPLSAAGSLAAYRDAQHRHRAHPEALTRRMTDGEMDAWLARQSEAPTPGPTAGEPTTSETSPLTRTGVNGVTGDGITMPRRVPERVLTLFVAPWTDSDGDLHEGETVYLTVAKSHWAEGGRRAYYAGRDAVRSVDSLERVANRRPAVEVGDATPSTTTASATAATAKATTTPATTKGPTGLSPDPHWVSSEGNATKATAMPNGSDRSERSERLMREAKALAQLPPTRPGTLEAMDEPTYPPVGVDVSDDPNDRSAATAPVASVAPGATTGTSTLGTATVNPTTSTSATAPAVTQAATLNESTEQATTDATASSNPPSTVALLAHKAKRNAEAKGTDKTN